MKKIPRNVRLEKYTPWVLKNAKEILAICQAENQEFNTLYGQIWRWFANTFIFNTDIAGVERWEKMLGIYPPEGASIFDRRAAIFLMVNGTTPYTEKSFEVLTDGMYHKGAVTLGVHPDSYTVVLNLADDMTERINEIRRYARLIIPANMTIQAARTVPVYSPVYAGAVVRKHCKSEVGRLAGDKVKRSSVSYNVARGIHEVNKADNIEITLNGLKPSPVMIRHGQEVSPSPTSQIGDFDDLFYVDADGNIRQKVGAPATFTRASTAVLGGRTYQVNEPRFMDNMLLLVQNEDGKATEQLTIAEWVVNKREWTFETEIKFVRGFKSWEWTPFFAYRDYDSNDPYSNAFRLEVNGSKIGVLKGHGVAEISYKQFELNTVYKLAVTWSEGIINSYIDGEHKATDYAIKKDPRPKTLSSIILGWFGTNGFIGCVGDIRFSSTVHTAEKIAADSKLDALPVEEDTVLYMPLKEDLSMYGKAVQ